MSESGACIDLLLVDDQAEFRGTTADFFEQRGYRVAQAEDGNQALQLAENRAFDVAVVDMVMPGLSGLKLLERLKTDGADGEVVLLTGEGTIETAVQAMRLGAYDFLTKPVKLPQLEVVVQKALAVGRLRKENRRLRAELNRVRPAHEMIGQSPAMQEVFRLIERAGPTDKPILIQGETGTGKELVARALHQASPMADNPLVVINCAALPELLLESELFGYEKGAFTGAVKSKPGLFEVAEGGTLFIDEIGEMAHAMQAKLLRVLEDGSLRRVGSVKERRVTVRLLTATNRNLADDVKSGRFREDLYYRIDVMTLRLPPLRDREGDIPLLAAHFAGVDWKTDPPVLEVFKRYPWPGNVRQLINAIERAKILGDDDIIRLQNLPPAVSRYADEPTTTSTDDLQSVEKSHIVSVLEREKGNKARTARALGISRRALYRLLEKHGIPQGDGR